MNERIRRLENENASLRNKTIEMNESIFSLQAFLEAGTLETNIMIGQITAKKDSELSFKVFDFNF